MSTTTKPSPDWLAQHGPRLALYARQWVPCHADAEDVVQTAYLRFWPRPDAARDPLAYLYRTVRNTAMNFNRSQSRRKQHEAMQTTHGPHREPMFQNPADQAEHRDLSERATESLTSLPIEQREVIVMRIWGQLTFDAIGQILDTPPRTAQSRYRAGIQSMQTHFASNQGDQR